MIFQDHKKETIILKVRKRARIKWAREKQKSTDRFFFLVKAPNVIKNGFIHSEHSKNRKQNKRSDTQLKNMLRVRAKPTKESQQQPQ